MKEETHTLAIVTRTKDRPLFLKRAINSVAKQTSKNFIHVIVNDGADKQKVEQVVSESAPKDYETKVLHINSHGKMEVSSNQGIKSCQSTYIAIHDDDDTWHPEFVEKSISFLKEGDYKGVVVRTNKVVESVQENGLKIDRLKETQWMPDMKAVNLYRQFIENQMTPITFMYERAVYDEIGGYDESLPVMGDWDFGIRFLLKHDVGYLDPGFALANYHHRKFKKGIEGNTSYGGNDKKVRFSNYLMNKYLREELKKGVIGPGYIMSKTKYEQNFMIRVVSKLLPRSVGRRFISRFSR